MHLPVTSLIKLLLCAHRRSFTQDWIRYSIKVCKCLDESLYEHSPDYVRRALSDGDGMSVSADPSGEVELADECSEVVTIEEPEEDTEGEEGADGNSTIEIDVSELSKAASVLRAPSAHADEVDEPLPTVFGGANVKLGVERHAKPIANDAHRDCGVRGC